METLERHERKLQEDKSWKLILEELSSGIVIIDKSKNITYTNPSTLKILKNLAVMKNESLLKEKLDRFRELLFNSKISYFESTDKEGIVKKAILSK